MTVNRECLWCGLARDECPDWWTHLLYHSQSETTWRRARLAAAVLTPDDEEMDRVR